MPLWEVDDILNSGHWDRLAYNQAVVILNEYATHIIDLTRIENTSRPDVRMAPTEGENKENVEPPSEQSTIFV